MKLSKHRTDCECLKRMRRTTDYLALIATVTAEKKLEC
jgi:hypothetical protein